MADTKITALAAITTVDPAADVLPIVDISDTSMAASGTTKKITTNQILGAGGTATLASATITGDLTVATSVLKVDSANTRVGINTTTINGGPFNVKISSAIDAKFVVQDGFTTGNVRLAAVDNAYTAYKIMDYSALSHAWYNSGSTAMTLNSTGLGVGVAPNRILDVRLDQSALTLARVQNQSTNSAAYAGYQISASGNNWGIWVGSSAANSNALAFVVDPSGTPSVKMTLDTSGNLLVGTTTTSGNAGGLKLSNVAGNLGQITFSNNSGSADYVARFNWGSTPDLVGNITVSSGGTAFNTTSDYRLKESVQPLVGGLARVNALKPSIYKWKTDGSNGEGFLAHELAESVPLAVTGKKDAVNEDGSIKPQGVDLSKVVPILVAAIQELTARVQTLEAK
jgi:hypothetical protein